MIRISSAFLGLTLLSACIGQRSNSGVDVSSGQTEQSADRSESAADANAEQLSLNAEELDILESVLRYQVDHNASSARAQNQVDYYFVSLFGHQDPPAALLGRFKDHIPPFEPVSQAGKSATSSVTQKQRGGRGVILRLAHTHWIDVDTVEIEGGYYEASRSSSVDTYRVERRDGRWAVVNDERHWIS